MSARRHHGFTLAGEGAEQVDIGELAADPDDRAERDPAQETAVVHVLERPGRRGGVDRDAAGGGAHDVQFRRVARVLFGRAEGCLRSPRVAPKADRGGSVQASRFEGDGGADAVEHEAGRQQRVGEGVPRTGVVGRDDRPPTTESPGHERKLPLIAVPERVGRIGGRTQAVDGALIGEQRPDRPVEGPPGTITVVTPDTAVPRVSVERNFTCHASALITRRNPLTSTGRASSTSPGRNVSSFSGTR
jgi:hypothetical protein